MITQMRKAMMLLPLIFHGVAGACQTDVVPHAMSTRDVAYHSSLPCLIDGQQYNSQAHSCI